MLSRSEQPQVTQIPYSRLNSEIRDTLKQALDGKEISSKQATSLFNAKGQDQQALLDVADKVRHNLCGDKASFVITRNINFTNVCYMVCKFCNFAKPIKHKDAEFISLEEVADRAQQAWDRGATEVCIQGGLHPQISAYPKCIFTPFHLLKFGTVHVVPRWDTKNFYKISNYVVWTQCQVQLLRFWMLKFVSN